MSRLPLIVGNWKMHKTVAEAEAFIQGLLPRVGAVDAVEIAICPPYTALEAMVDSARGSSVQVYAQNMHDADAGAFTGEISARMLSELDVGGVILGHSERRRYFSETDRTLAIKVPHALQADLTPILCVGETEDERAEGATESRLSEQVRGALQSVPVERLGEVVLAYEPVWAIGSGAVASPEQAQAAASFIRGLVADLDPRAGEQVRVLYGGSLIADNASDLLGSADVDGALVGGASLDPASFASIVDLAARSRA